MGINEARVKLNWAREHIRKFEAEFGEFLDSDPYTVWVKGQRVRLSIKNRPKEEWGLIIGDAVHNLRSSLDHLIYQLSLQTTPNPGRDIEFPIFETQPSGDALRKRIKHLPPKAREIVRSLQPYKGGQERARDHRLYTLYSLDNADKHRSLSVVTYGLVITVIAGGKSFSQPPIWGDFHDGQEFTFFYQLLGTGDLSKVKVETKAQPVIGISFDDFGETRVIEIYPMNNLAKTFHWIRRRAFDALEPFFISATKG